MASSDMSFLKKLFGHSPRNPTEGFSRNLMPPPLAWNHTARTLCGIPLPSPVEAFAPLGPAETFRAVGENTVMLGYPHLGLELEVQSGRVTLFTILISPEEKETSLPGLHFGRPLLEPGRLLLEPGTPLESVQTLLGEGRLMDEDEEDGTIWIFQSADVSLEVAHAPDGRLLRIEGYDDHS